MIVLQTGREGLLLLTTISSNRPNSKVLNLQIKKTGLHLSFNVFRTKVLIENNI